MKCSVSSSSKLGREARLIFENGEITMELEHIWELTMEEQPAKSCVMKEQTGTTPAS